MRSGSPARIVVAFAVALAALALALAAPSASATFPGKNGAIYFVRQDTRSEWHQDIYSVRAKGTSSCG